jgi:hypothetical protein
MVPTDLKTIKGNQSPPPAGFLSPAIFVTVKK